MGSIPTEVKRFFLYLVWFPDSFTKLTPSGLFMGSISSLIYTSEFIVRRTVQDVVDRKRRVLWLTHMVEPDNNESSETRVGSVGLCRHNFEHNTISGARHNAGIILIFFQHNAVVSGNSEKYMQILPAL